MTAGGLCLFLPFWIISSVCDAADQIIPAEPGQNVSLPCRAADSKPVIVVEWSRTDLGSDYVLLNRDNHSDPVKQHLSFKNRVDLKDPQMKDGDVSAVLKNVTMDDSGRYECRVVQKGTNRRKRAMLDSDPISIIHLVVAPPPPPGRGPYGLTAALLLFTVIAVMSVIIYKKKKKSGFIPHDGEKSSASLQPAERPLSAV